MKKFIYMIIAFACCFQLNAQEIEWEEATVPPDNFIGDHTYGFSFGDIGYLITGQSPTRGFQDDFYKYDSTTDTWSDMGTFPGGGRGFGIGDQEGDKAYFCFGVNNQMQNLETIWMFDSVTEEWDSLTTAPGGFRLHPAFVVTEGVIYFGLGSNGQANLKDFYQYVIADDEWTRIENLPGHARHHPYQFGKDGKIYVGLGHGSIFPFIYQDWYVYDREEELWTKLSSIPGEGRVAGTQFAFDGKGYVLSGDGNDHNSMGQGEFYQYDPAEDEWSELPDHPGFSRWAPASYIINGVVYLYTGTSNNQYMRTALKFDLEEYLANVVTNEEIELNNAQVKVYPNPFQTTVAINIDRALMNKYSVIDAKVFDITGKVVYSANNINANSTIDLTDVNLGSYIIEFTSNDKIIASEKLMKTNR